MKTLQILTILLLGLNAFYCIEAYEKIQSNIDESTICLQTDGYYVGGVCYDSVYDAMEVEQ